MKKFEDYSYEELLELKKKLKGSTIAIEAASFLGGIYIAPELAVFLLSFLPYLFLKDNLETKIVQKDHDIVAIKEIYEEYIKSLINLASDMNVKNPLDIYFMIYFMYDYSIFSYDKLDHYEVNSYLIEKEIMGPIALNGHGVCRHISVLLQKVYSMMGYESDVCLGFFNILESQEQKEQIMKIMEALSLFKLSSGMREKIVKIISTANIRDEHMKKITSLGSIREGNHLISRANFNGATLMLDVYNGEIYTQVTRDLFLPKDCGFSKILRDERDVCFMPYIKQNNHICDEFGIQKISENYDYSESLFDKEIKLARRNYGCIEAVDTYKNFHKTHLNELYELESHLQKVLRKKY